jgi:2-deoxy-D-gluconate 3-dehydrogenase
MTGPFDLTSRVAVVTGANSRIGLGMALGLAAAGAKIAVVGRSAEKNQAAVAKITEAACEAMAIEADVVQEDDCRRLVREAGARSSASDFITGAAIPVDGHIRLKSEIGLPAPLRP